MDQYREAEGGITIIGVERTDSLHVNGDRDAGIEPEASRDKQTVRVADHQTLNRRAAVPGDAEGPLVERAEPAGPAPGPLGKNEDIAAGCKIFSDILNMADHERRIIVSRLRGDVTGLPQNPAEDRHVEKGVLDDRLLFLEQGDEENRIEIRQVVADDDGRADRPDLIPDIQGDPGGDEAQ